MPGEELVEPALTRRKHIDEMKRGRATDCGR